MSLKLNGGTGIEFTSNTQFVDNAQLKFKTTSQTFTVKGIDAAITDSQTSTTPDTSDSDSGQLAIYNGATKLWGVTEHGYVIKPNIPAYNASIYSYNQPNSGDPGDSGSFNYNNSTSYGDAVIKASRMRFNNGNHYDPTTGYFTCPIDGIYVASFNANWYTQNVSSWLRPSVYKNGDPIHWFYHEKDVTWQQLGGCVTISANAGDYIYFYKASSSGGGGGADSDQYAHFSIYLLA
tara:strand:+ start:32 stop:736 length:705 start_codon:yes stop_codon:yes gene_type:complete